MVKALARAFRWKRLLDSGWYASISELAAAEKIDRGYVGRKGGICRYLYQIPQAQLEPDTTAHTAR
jgi:hypothetical protein